MRSYSLIEKDYQGFHIGSTMPLSRKQLEALLVLNEKPPGEQLSPLSGRTAIIKKTIGGIGSVVIKPYLRGGMMARLQKDRYINTGSCRAKEELHMLLKAEKYHINVPEPVCYFQKGLLFYRCWLVTKEISNKGSIAQISQADPQLAKSLMTDGWRQVEHLVLNRIYHVDFHPGNVISGNDGKIYLLDFDKAFMTKMERIKLFQKYITRWNRAVKKHNLPDILLK